jgi:hypothetical protein
MREHERGASVRHADSTPKRRPLTRFVRVGHNTAAEERRGSSNRRTVHGLFILVTTPLTTNRLTRFHLLTQEQLRTLIEASAANPATPTAAQIGSLYKSFMAEAAVDAVDAKPLASDLDAIQAVSVY